MYVYKAIREEKHHPVRLLSPRPPTIYDVIAAFEKEYIYNIVCTHGVFLIQFAPTPPLCFYKIYTIYIVY